MALWYDTISGKFIETSEVIDAVELTWGKVLRELAKR